MKKQWSIILAIVLLILIALFAMANMEVVPVQFGFASFRWPLIMVILGSLLSGALIATLISVPVNFTHRKEKRETEKRLHEFETNQSSEVDEVKRKYEQKMDQLKSEKERLKNRVKELERENRNRRAAQLSSNEDISSEDFPS